MACPGINQKITKNEYAGYLPSSGHNLVSKEWITCQGNRGIPTQLEKPLPSGNGRPLQPEMIGINDPGNRLKGQGAAPRRCWRGLSQELVIPIERSPKMADASAEKFPARQRFIKRGRAFNWTTTLPPARALSRKISARFFPACAAQCRDKERR